MYLDVLGFKPEPVTWRRGKDGVFQMDVAVEIFLKLMQAREQRPVGIARFRRRGEIVRQVAEAGQRGTGVVVLVQHAGDRAIQGQGAFAALCHGDDGGKQDLFLLHDVAGKLVLHGGEHLIDLHQRRSVSAMHVGDAFGHRVQARKIIAEIGVMSGPMCATNSAGGRRAGFSMEVPFSKSRSLQLIDDRFRRDALEFAGFAQSAAALAAEIDAEGLENPGERG